MLTTVPWGRSPLSVYNHLFAQLYDFKYFYLIQMICKELFDIKYSYLIQIICTELFDIKYSYLIQIICTANGLGDLDTIPSHVIPKTLKMVSDTSLLNTQHYKVRIKGKGVAPSLHLSVVAIEKRAFWSSSTMIDNFNNHSYLILIICTVVYFQILQFNTNNLYSIIHGIKYFYLILMIFKQTYLTYRWDDNSHHKSGSVWTEEQPRTWSLDTDECQIYNTHFWW